MPPTQPNHWLAMIAGGRADAIQFLAAWGDYIRPMDNMLDEGPLTREAIAKTFALGCSCYSTPFYLNHRHQLQMTVLLTTSTYADSIHMEKAPELWKRQWADVLRHADGSVVSAVAIICRGWEWCRKVSPAFIVAAYLEHKQNHGVPE